MLIVYVMSNNNARLPRNKHFVLTFVDISHYISRLMTSKKQKQNGVNGCVQGTQSDFFDDFSGVFDGSFHGII